MATHCSILAWIIPRTEEAGGLQSIGSQRVRHSCSHLSCMYTFTGLPLWLSDKELRPVQETRVRSLGGKDPLGEKMAT